MERTASPSAAVKDAQSQHAGNAGVAIIAAGLDDIARLTADLDAILARRPNGTGSDVLWTQPSLGGTVRSGLSDRTDEADAKDGDTDFTWIEGASDVSPRPDQPAAGADAAARWVKKARRQRLSGRLRAVASWIVTVVLGGAIVGASVYVLLGRLPGLDDVFALSQRVWM